MTPRTAIRAAALALLSLSSLQSCTKSEPPPPQILRPVRAVRIAPASVARERSFSGTARASVESKLSFKVDGTVLNVPVEVGDVVKAEDLIAELDRDDLQLQLDDAKASLNQAEAEERNASSELERTRAGYEAGTETVQAYERALTAAEAAKAAVDSLGKKVELADRNLKYATLTAPINGAIASVDIEVNENVRAGQTIVVLASGRLAEVAVSIPESFISSVRQGAAVSVTFDALTDRVMLARVTEVGITTQSGGTFPVTCQLDEPDFDIRPGMAASVVFSVAQDDGVIRFVVPNVCVKEDVEGRYVMVAVSQGGGTAKIERRKVQTGRLYNDGIEVLGGLEAGDLVVTAGLKVLTDGDTVRLDPTWVTYQ